jgi:hypothetical protein
LKKSGPLFFGYPVLFAEAMRYFAMWAFMSAPARVKKEKNILF